MDCQLTIVELRKNIHTCFLSLGKATNHTSMKINSKKYPKLIYFPIYVSPEGREFGVTDNICVKFKSDINTEAKNKIIEKYNLILIKTRFYDLYNVPQNSDIFSIANDIYNSGLVKYSHPDFFGSLHYHTDTYYNYQFPLYNTNDYTADVDAP